MLLRVVNSLLAYGLFMHWVWLLHGRLLESEWKGWWKPPAYAWQLIIGRYILFSLIQVYLRLVQYSFYALHFISMLKILIWIIQINNLKLTCQIQRLPSISYRLSIQLLPLYYPLEQRPPGEHSTEQWGKQKLNVASPQFFSPSLNIVFIQFCSLLIKAVTENNPMPTFKLPCQCMSNHT